MAHSWLLQQAFLRPALHTCIEYASHSRLREIHGIPRSPFPPLGGGGGYDFCPEPKRLWAVFDGVSDCPSLQDQRLKLFYFLLSI